MLDEASRLFAPLSEPTRLRIVRALHEADELSVRALADRTGSSLANTSQNLNRLAAGSWRADATGRACATASRTSASDSSARSSARACASAPSGSSCDLRTEMSDSNDPGACSSGSEPRLTPSVPRSHPPRQLPSLAFASVAPNSGQGLEIRAASRTRGHRTMLPTRVNPTSLPQPRQGVSPAGVLRNDAIGLGRAVHAQQHQGGSGGHRP